jgi:hypothetical protein
MRRDSTAPGGSSAMTELSVPRVCQYCGGNLPPYKPGPARIWCKELCRKRAGRSAAPGATRVTRKKWTREAIVAAIQAWADEYGEPPAQPDWTPATARAMGDEPRAQRFEATAGRFPGHMTVIGEFGSWNAAITAAGFTPRPSGGGGGNELRRRSRATA